MKHIFFFNGIFIFSILLFLSERPERTSSQTDPLFTIQQKKIQALKCYPDLSSDGLTPDDALSMIPLPGWGNYKWKITTIVDSCQYYFNQGMAMYYSFHIIEALASFKKSRTLDSNSAMSWWGEALAYGPNINDVEYNATPDALYATTKAASLMNNISAREKGLIKAMQVRYTNDTGLTRAELNKRYENSMLGLYQQFPGDAEVGTLYADAIMLVHPWDLYDDQSVPRPWTPELTAVLEKMIRINPNHPGANHYYIHAVEASLQPERANHSAAVLPELMPKVSHVVHMPSHIYIRTGAFEKGMDLNIKANKGYGEYLALMPEVINNAFLYQLHNIHLQANCAMMFGNAEISTRTAAECRNDISADYLPLPAPTGDYIQYMYMLPAFSMIRYGQWNELLQMPVIPDSLAYAKILYHFGRGFAYARLNQVTSAQQELAQLQQIQNSVPSLKIKMGAFNSAYDGSVIAEKMLAGAIAEANNQLPEAAGFFREAVASETKLVYNEPRDWILPAREYLGNVLLKNKQWAEAETVFKKDLIIHPGNGWATIGLINALKSQGKKAEVKELSAKAAVIKKNKNFNPAGAVF